MEGFRNDPALRAAMQESGVTAADMPRPWEKGPEVADAQPGEMPGLQPRHHARHPSKTQRSEYSTRADRLWSGNSRLPSVGDGRG